MTQLLFIPLFLFTFFNAPSKDADDFKRELNKIADDFRDNIMDEDKCRLLQSDAGNLVDDIEDEIDNDPEDLSELQKLKKDAEALEEYMGALLGSNYIPSIEVFNKGNQMVGGIVINVSTGKFCVDVVKVSINEFVSYMFQNNTLQNYTVTYKWKANTGMNSGSGEMGLTTKSVRQFYDNREKPEQKSITAFAITCKEFASFPH